MNFNPRSPYGERPYFPESCLITVEFQSTLPLRGATCDSFFAYQKPKISIHAPLTGSDSLGVSDFYGQ